jgi:hypothetical protein
MINSLIIGDKEDIKKYTDILGTIKLFGKPENLFVTAGKPLQKTFNEKAHDAYLIVSPLQELFEPFSKLVKHKENIYFTDQPSLSAHELKELEHLQNEAGNIVQPEVIELYHPLTEEFISARNHHLFFRYTKSVPSKRDVRASILSALSFLSLLSPMPVKKMDVSTIESSKHVRPHIKIRLKMYDSSISYIIIRVDPTPEHNIIIESKEGSFAFNFTENYVENIHGAKIPCTPVSEGELRSKSLRSFALNIALNKKPAYNLDHYTLSVSILSKLGNILMNGF